jgi:hypothetical protein
VKASFGCRFRLCAITAWHEMNLRKRWSVVRPDEHRRFISTQSIPCREVKTGLSSLMRCLTQRWIGRDESAIWSIQVYEQQETEMSNSFRILVILLCCFLIAPSDKAGRQICTNLTRNGTWSHETAAQLRAVCFSISTK